MPPRKKTATATATKKAAPSKEPEPITRPRVLATVPAPNRRIGLVGGLNMGQEPFDPRGHFAKSLQGSVTVDDLKKLSETILFDRAIERISNGVAGMAWTVVLPEELQEDDAAHEKAKHLTRALQRPSEDIHDTYTKLVKAIIRDMLVFGCGAIERQPGLDEKSQPFWLWPVNIRSIKLDPSWDASREGIDPRFWYCPPGMNASHWVPILNKNMFLIQARTSTYEITPPSPVRLAYETMNTWLNLHGFQGRTVSQAVRDYMICLEDANEDEVDAFREYWRTNVVGMGEIPTIGGKVNVVKFGAKTDEELFLKFTDYLTGLLALQFGLSHRDFGLQHEDAYATADVAQDMSFQNAILPIAMVVIEALNNKVIDFYEPDFAIELANAEPTKEIEEAQRADLVYKDGIVTKNEARRMIGEKPVPGGDEFASQGEAGGQSPGQSGEIPKLGGQDIPEPGSDGKVVPLNKKDKKPVADKGKQVALQASSRQLSLF